MIAVLLGRHNNLITPASRAARKKKHVTYGGGWREQRHLPDNVQGKHRQAERPGLAFFYAVKKLNFLLVRLCGILYSFNQAARDRV